MPFVKGYLKILRGGGGAPGTPDQGLPGEEPGYPDQGLPDEPEDGAPVIPGNLPSPPPGVWPPLSPSFPIQPAPPMVPPGAIWPPVYPPVVGGGPAPTPPPSPTPTPPIATPGKFWIVAGIPGVGWRYVCVDPSLVAGHPLPPTPQPK
jgi:hypothetical protein